MEKEELLTKLKELQNEFGTTLLDEQVKQLDEHYENRRNIQEELKSLIDKVKDDKNYTKNVVTFVDIEEIKDQIERTNIETHLMQ